MCPAIRRPIRRLIAPLRGERTACTSPRIFAMKYSQPRNLFSVITHPHHCSHTGVFAEEQCFPVTFLECDDSKAQPHESNKGDHYDHCEAVHVNLLSCALNIGHITQESTGVGRASGCRSHFFALKGRDPSQRRRWPHWLVVPRGVEPRYRRLSAAALSDRE